MNERLLSVDEIAAHLGANLDAIYKWITRQSVPAHIADYLLADGSMSSNQSGEGDIRRVLLEADLPGQPFYSTPFGKN